MRVMTPTRSARQRGQVLVIFVLALVALLAAAGLAIDIGRFYSERRFLQNGADAAALAAGSVLVRGGTEAEARAEAMAVLSDNYSIPPNGIVPALPPGDGNEVYDSGHAGDPTHLISGILFSGGSVRVGIRNTIPYTFGRAVGLTSNMIVAQAKVALDGDLLPIAVRHYLNAPGPTTGAVSPCAGNTANFQDLVATANTACLGSETNSALRQDPSPGMDFDPANPDNDPTHHGPIISLVLGQGAKAGNSSSFRGFVALDIRNFQSASSNVFYNGVTAGANANTLKSTESGWIPTGYPGPAFPSVIAPPDPNDQVAIMGGNSAGIAVSAVDDRYAPGDEILAAVYPGIMMTIPDFSVSSPGAIPIAASGRTANVGSFKVVPQQGVQWPGDAVHHRRRRRPEQPARPGHDAQSVKPTDLHPQSRHAVAGQRHHGLRHRRRDIGRSRGDLRHLAQGTGRQPIPDHELHPVRDQRGRRGQGLLISTTTNTQSGRSHR